MLPGFRPDKALGIELPGFAEYIKKLGESAGVEIKSYKDVISALLARIDFFNAAGCRVSDHAFSYMPYVQDSEEQIEVSFERAMSGEKISQRDADAYKTAVMQALGENIIHSAGLWKFISAQCEITTAKCLPLSARTRDLILWETIKPLICSADFGFALQPR